MCDFDLFHDIGDEMTVLYDTTSSQNPRELNTALEWFKWASIQKDQSVVLEDALQKRYCIGGYDYLAHARLLRSVG